MVPPPTDLAAAIEIVAARIPAQRLRALTDPMHPDYRAEYVDAVMELAVRLCIEPGLPSLSRMAAQAASAVWQVARAAVKGEDLKVPREAYEGRLEICRSCDHYRASDRRCGKVDGCGCFLEKKAWAAALSCPLEEPRWGPWTPVG